MAKREIVPPKKAVQNSIECGEYLKIKKVDWQFQTELRNNKWNSFLSVQLEKLCKIKRRCIIREAEGRQKFPKFTKEDSEDAKQQNNDCKFLYNLSKSTIKNSDVRSVLHEIQSFKKK